MIISYRVGPAQYDRPERLEGLAALLERYRPACDEVSLFTSHLHSYEPLEDLRVQIEHIRTAMARLRRAGFRVGINVLNTLGHFDEAPTRLPRPPWQVMVGHDGKECRQISCPASPEFHEDLRRRYALVAQAGPDFIWVDDDLRMHSHRPVEFGCFCPRCVAEFCAPRGLDPSRVKLTEELGRETWPQPNPLRGEWVERCGELLKRVLVSIEQAVHTVDPNMELGLMTAGVGWSAYAGSDYASRLDALRGGPGSPVRLRPGGGFYDDEVPIVMVRKAHEIAEQIARGGGGLSSVQYEQESFPYHRLQKSIRALLLENTLALAAGCDGVANNVLASVPDPLDDYAPILKGVQQWRPMWESLVAACDGLPLTGLWAGTPPHYAALARVGDRWPEGSLNAASYGLGVLADIGLPLAAAAEHACGVVLDGARTTGLNRSGLERMLARGALMDHEAVAVLWELGLGELAGVRPTPIEAGAVMEELTDHPLNGPYPGYHRDGRPGFFGGTAALLEPIAEGVEVLSELTSIPLPGKSPDLPGAGCTAYENPLGGRVVVFGYQAWRFIHSEPKVRQMRLAADWICRGRLPVLIEPCVKLVPFARLSAERDRFVIVLLNASLDPTEPVRMVLRAAAGPVATLRMDGTWSTEEGARVLDAQQGGMLVELGPIEPWGLRIIGRPPGL